MRSPPGMGIGSTSSPYLAKKPSSLATHAGAMLAVGVFRPSRMGTSAGAAVGADAAAGALPATDAGGDAAPLAGARAPPPDGEAPPLGAPQPTTPTTTSSAPSKRHGSMAPPSAIERSGRRHPTGGLLRRSPTSRSVGRTRSARAGPPGGCPGTAPVGRRAPPAARPPAFLAHCGSPRAARAGRAPSRRTRRHSYAPAGRRHRSAYGGR